MMKRSLTILFTVLHILVFSETYTWQTHYEYSPAAGQAGSTAVPLSSPSFLSWADGYTNLVFGEEVTAYKDPALALGPAVGGSFDVLCLGRGGEVTLSFSSGVRDGNGADFAVFENAFNDYFLELAHVEVSSDGMNFVRFPNYSLNAPGGQLLATKLFGLAGKFRESYGTPFDLNEIRRAHQAALDGNTDFSEAYAAQLTNGFQTLDFEHIRYIRLVDVINNDAASLDSRGETIADPAAQTGTAGFDLDAIGVINRSVVSGTPQEIAFGTIPHQKLVFQTLELTATSDSGLPVQFAATGPVTVVGNMLTFNSTGTVEVIASQPGDWLYAPASPVLRSFRIAEALQHIFVEPVHDQLMDGPNVQVRAYSSSGLPVRMQVRNGPDTVWMDEESHLLNLGEGAFGPVTLRAFQPGDAVYAPAEDVLVHFQLLETGALIEFSDWLSSNAVPDPVYQTLEDAYGRSAITLEYPMDARVKTSSRILQSSNLVLWTTAVPEIVEMSSSNALVRLLTEETNRFYRIEFEGQ